MLSKPVFSGKSVLIKGTVSGFLMVFIRKIVYSKIYIDQSVIMPPNKLMHSYKLYINPLKIHASVCGRHHVAHHL